MKTFYKNVLDQEQIIALNYVSAHCVYHKRPPKWYEQQFALKGHTRLSDYLRSELPTNGKATLQHNDMETLTSDLFTYTDRCQNQGEPFRFLTEPDVIEPDHTDEQSFLIWAKRLGFDVDMESWSLDRASKLAPIHLGCLAAKTRTMISLGNTPWAVWLAQLVTDWHKSLRSHKALTSPLHTDSLLDVALSFGIDLGVERGPPFPRSGDKSDVIVRSGKMECIPPKLGERHYVKSRIERQFDMVRMGSRIVKLPVKSHSGRGQADGLAVDDDGHGGKLAFLTCLYKRLHTKVELSFLIDMSKRQSLIELLLFLCHAVFEKLGHPRCLPSDPAMLAPHITEITKLYNNIHRPLRTIDYMPVPRKNAQEVLACLRDQYPGDLGSINLQSVTRKQFAIVVGFYIGQTIWAPRPESGAWYLIGIATDIANGAYPPGVSILLDELHLGPANTLYHSGSTETETDVEDQCTHQLEETVASLSLPSQDTPDGSAEGQFIKHQPGSPSVKTDPPQCVVDQSDTYLKILVSYVTLHEGSSHVPLDFMTLYEDFMQKGLWNFLKLCRKCLDGAFRPQGTCRHDLLVDLEDLQRRVKTRNGRDFTRIYLNHPHEPGLSGEAVLLLLGQAAKISVPECSHDTLVKVALLTGMLLAKEGFYVVDSSSIMNIGHGFAIHFLPSQECSQSTAPSSVEPKSPSAADSWVLLEHSIE